MKVPADHYGGLVVFPLIDHSCDVRMIAQLAWYPVSPSGMIELLQANTSIVTWQSNFRSWPR
jgi:hypothetical protein